MKLLIAFSALFLITQFTIAQCNPAPGEVSVSIDVVADPIWL